MTTDEKIEFESLLNSCLASAEIIEARRKAAATNSVAKDFYTQCKAPETIVMYLQILKTLNLITLVNALNEQITEMHQESMAANSASAIQVQGAIEQMAAAIKSARKLKQ